MPTSPSTPIARSGCRQCAQRRHPLKFDIKASPPAPPLERQNIPTELKLDAPGLLQAPLSAKAEVRLNGSVVMINGLTGALGDGAFNGWASVDLASKPLVKLDLDFQRLSLAMSRTTVLRRRSPGATRPSISTASIMSTHRRRFPRPTQFGDGRFAPPLSTRRSPAAC